MAISLPTPDELVAAVEARRGKLGLRKIAAQVGTSSATMHRFIHGQMPDWNTVERIVAWLDGPERCPKCGQPLPGPQTNGGDDGRGR